MDRDRIFAITHGDRAFHNPLEPARVPEALDRLGLGAGDRVLDVGCGAGGLPRARRRRRGSSSPPARRDVEPGGDHAAACCVGSLHALGGLADGLRRLRGAIAPGGAVVIADGFWERRPDPAFLAALGASEDALPSLEGLPATCADAGLEPVWVATSTAEEWQRYEWTLVSNGDRWIREHPGDPLAADVRAWIDAARARLLAPGGMETIGFALVVLRGG